MELCRPYRAFTINPQQRIGLHPILWYAVLTGLTRCFSGIYHHIELVYACKDTQYSWDLQGNFGNSEKVGSSFAKIRETDLSDLSEINCTNNAAIR